MICCLFVFLFVKPPHRYPFREVENSCSCKLCGVLLCFINPILGNRYGPGISSCWQTSDNLGWLPGRILTLHVNYVAGYISPLLFLFEHTHNCDRESLSTILPALPQLTLGTDHVCMRNVLYACVVDTHFLMYFFKLEWLGGSTVPGHFHVRNLVKAKTSNQPKLATFSQSQRGFTREMTLSQHKFDKIIISRNRLCHIVYASLQWDVSPGLLIDSIWPRKKTSGSFLSQM